MLRSDGNIKRYIGGGKIFFTKKGDDESKRYEIGEIQEAKINIETTTADAFNKDSVMQKMVDKAVTDIKAKIEFTTQNVNETNLAMCFLGDVEEVTIAASAKLPDGTTAAKETKIKKIKAGTNPIFEGKLEFIGDEDGDEKAVIEVPRVIISPNGGIDYIGNEWAKIGFSGDILLSNSGEYFNEYRIPLAKA